MFGCRLLMGGPWLSRVAQADLLAEVLWEATQVNPPLLQQLQQHQRQGGTSSNPCRCCWEETGSGDSLTQEAAVRGPFTCPSKAAARRCCSHSAMATIAAAAAGADGFLVADKPKGTAAVLGGSSKEPPRGPLLQLGALIGSFLFQKLQGGPQRLPSAIYGLW